MCFVGGVCGFQLLSRLPGLSWLVLLIGLFAVCLYWRRFYLLFVLIGWSWAWSYAAWSLANRLPATLEGITLEVNAEIVSLPSCDSGLCRFNAVLELLHPEESVLNHHQIDDFWHSGGSGKRTVRLSWYSSPKVLQAGQHWRLSVRLKRPHGMKNPGGFDYEQWLFARGIDATGYVRCENACQLINEPDRSLFGGLLPSFQHNRQLLYENLTHELRESPVAGLIIGMVVGIRDGITEQQWTVLRNTGTAHLMAISGLHIGLIAGLMFWLTRHCCAWAGILRYSPQQLAALSAMIFASGYAVLAGLSLPTQRALIMLAIVFGSVVLQTRLRPFHLLALSASVVVLLNPLSVLEAGFWLSFGAVAVISLMLVGRQSKQGYLGTTWVVGWRVALGLGPLLLLFFGNASLIAPVANLIAVPVTSLLVVPAALIGVVISSFSGQLAKIVFEYTSVVLSSVMWFLEQLAEFDFATLSLPKPSLPAVMISLAGVLLLMLPRGIRYRWMGLIMLLPVVFPVTQKIEQGVFKLTVLDVGQGLSNVVETANHTLVFDTGIRLGSGFDIGSMVVLPYLRNQAIHQVDLLVLSHSDADHVGGAKSLLSGLPVIKTIASDPQQLPFEAIQRCQAGAHWRWDGVSFTMLAPLDPYFDDDNNNSCVLQISAGERTVMLSGDIESEAEIRLVQHYGKRLHSQVLVAPHHGSQTSSSQTFLEMVGSEFVIVSAGYRNRYGFPHQSVMNRYQEMAIQVLNTASSGAVSVIPGNNDNLQNVTEYRKKSMRYWNDY
ncbi:MAG: DNA internalization-related competence protein ComEC/Rec2 [Gammaproteobacteria bacterium]|nr:DNA internalization-related competence protein ComEC/Rec2 [Gammaproteobacteria bacterium]